MNNETCFKRAKKALDKAHEESMKAWLENGGGWGDWDTEAIRNNIEEHLAFEFGQGPKPETI